MTVVNGEMENIIVGKRGGGCSTNGHMTVGKEGGGGGGGGGWAKGAGGQRRRGGEGRDGLRRPVLFGLVG